MALTLQPRYLKVVIRLQSGSFNFTDADTVTFDGKEGFRMSFEGSQNGGLSGFYGHVMIWGVTQDVMDRIFVQNYMALDKYSNFITVYATDDDGEYSIVYNGLITQAMPDYMGMPDVPLIIDAVTNLEMALSKPAPDSYAGVVSISSMAKKIATDMGLSFENNGVDGNLTDEYLPGSTLDKLKKLSEDAAFDYYFDISGKILAICPRGKPRASTQIKVNVSTGLIGYPSKTIMGVAFTHLYSSALQMGIPIYIDSDLKPCVGQWFIFAMNYMLDCNVPNGAWHIHAQASPSQYVVTR